MKAVILAGGKGSRLQKLTDHVPKALLPIGERSCLDQILSNLYIGGISDAVIQIGYRGDMIRGIFDKRKRYTIGIEFAEETETHKKGMAFGIYDARDYVNEDFLVTACDTVFPFKYIKPFIDYHNLQNNDATLSIADLGKKKLLVGRSCVELQEDNSITRIIEKPSKNRVISTIVSTPMYIFSQKIFDYIPRIKKSRRGEYELQSAIQLMIDDGCRVQGYMNEEWNSLENWKMLNDCNDFLRLNFEYMKDLLELR